MNDDARSMELNAADYMVPDGVEKLLTFIRKRLNIRDLDLETEAFDKYFNKMMRQKGETLTKYIHAEEIAYRKLQRILKEATDGGTDEFSGDDDDSPPKDKNPTSKTTTLLVIHGKIPNSIKRIRGHSKYVPRSQYRPPQKSNDRIISRPSSEGIGRTFINNKTHLAKENQQNHSKSDRTP